MKKIFLAVLLLATFVLSGCDTQAAVNRGSVFIPGLKDDLKISMLNIRHGDAILIQTPEQTILIDSGNTQRRADFVNELAKLSVTKIDKLIITHPHGDHIGGAKLLINPSEKEISEYPYLKKISVAEVYDNGIAHGSGLYKNYLKAIAAKGIPYRSLKTGDTLIFGGGVKFEVLFPTSEFVATVNNGQFDKEDKAYNVNNGSIVGRLTYKDFSMMFTGDCEKESEAKILAANRPGNLKCDILKSGHHGINTSSSKKFVATINPSYALISAGPAEDGTTEYKPPHLPVLERYLAQGIDKKNILCTYWNGTITVMTDGKSFSVKPEKREDWIDKWIAMKKEQIQKK